VHSVIATAASYAICFLLAVASTARVKELSLNPAVESTGAVSHDILSFSARVLNTTASVGALNSFEG